jgi:hypothetical protein
VISDHLKSWLAQELQNPASGIHELCKVIEGRAKLHETNAIQPGDTDFEKGQVRAYREAAALPMQLIKQGAELISVDGKN